MKLEFSQQIFEKSSNIKFDENKSSGSRVFFNVVGRTDITKQIVAFVRTRLKTYMSYHSTKPGAATWILSALRHSELVEAQISFYSMYYYL
jgi:hypothetical protein